MFLFVFVTSVHFKLHAKRNNSKKLAYHFHFLRIERSSTNKNSNSNQTDFFDRKSNKESFNDIRMHSVIFW